MTLIETTPDAGTPAVTTGSASAASGATPDAGTPAVTTGSASAASGATPDTGTPAMTPGSAPALAGQAAPGNGWIRVCRVDDLLVERGAAALLGDRQIALFRTFDGRIFATDQIDPFSGAAILSRGIVGDRGGVPTVASPMYKQVFDLRTGACLDTQGKEPLSVAVHPVTVADGDVYVKLAPAARAASEDPAARAAQDEGDPR